MINRFISFEGIDGAGKTTQIELLKKRLEKNNYKVKVFREPGGMDISESLRKIILNKSFDISSNTEMLLFLAARSELVTKVIYPALEKGYYVICDRYIDSTVAYQGFGRKIDIKIINDLNKFVTLGLLPTVTFYLDIPVKTMILRKNKENNDRMENSGLKFFERVRSGYFDLELKNNRFVKIDASQNIKKIETQIWSSLNDFFKDL
tara:strand:- start:673 stop:1290 length:618 start_codon:yes stop_codon:yes gene_type:complete